MLKRILLSLVMLPIVALTASQPSDNGAQAQTERCITFGETGKSVCGQLLDYWQNHGGLTQQGYPISEAFQEINSLEGKTYTVQYFERAVLELHPENQPPYNVLLGLLGLYQYQNYYGPYLAPKQHPSTDDSIFFEQTGHSLGGSFRTYWEQHGGLMQQGYPISDEFDEVNPLDGKTYTVQYFERAVFEHHPENAGTPFDVLLSQLGSGTVRPAGPQTIFTSSSKIRIKPNVAST